MALARLPVEGSLFGMPDVNPQQYSPSPSFSLNMSSPSASSTFGDVAPLGGTPTVPATANQVQPYEIAGQQQQQSWGSAPSIWNPPYLPVPQPTDPNLPILTGSAFEPIDPSRYDPNLSWDDYYNNYHAPDRDAVLRSYPGGGGSYTIPPYGQPQSVAAPNVDPSAPGPNPDPAPTAPPTSVVFDPAHRSPTTGTNGGGDPGGVPPPPTAPAPTGGAPSPWPTTPPPLGFDPTKWTDPNKHDPKYDVGHMVAQRASNDEIERYLQQFYPGWHVTGNDIITDPQGNAFDFRFDQEGANNPMWELMNGGGAQQQTAPRQQQSLFDGSPLLQSYAAPQSAPTSQGFGGIAYYDPNQPFVLTDTNTGQTYTSPPSGDPTGGDYTGGGSFPRTAPPTVPGGATQTSPGGGGGTVPVGNDPLSGQINGALSGALSGQQSPFTNNIANQLLNILSGNGMMPNLSNQLQSARTTAARSLNTELSDMDAALAARGLASTPGVAQGASIGGAERVADTVSANFADSLRDIEAHGLDIASANELQALSLATGLSQSQSQNLLQAIGLGTDRQSALASIALQQLAQNQSWNQFILSYGLDQQRLAEDIAQGRVDNVIRLLQIYLQGGATAAGGYY